MPATIPHRRRGGSAMRSAPTSCVSWSPSPSKTPGLDEKVVSPRSEPGRSGDNKRSKTAVLVRFTSVDQGCIAHRRTPCVRSARAVPRLGTFEVDAGGARSPSVGTIKHAVLANLLKRANQLVTGRDASDGRTLRTGCRAGSPCYMLVVDLPLRTMTGPRRLLHPQVSGRGGGDGEIRTHEPLLEG